MSNSKIPISSVNISSLNAQKSLSVPEKSIISFNIQNDKFINEPMPSSSNMISSAAEDSTYLIKNLKKDTTNIDEKQKPKLATIEEKANELLQEALKSDTDNSCCNEGEKVVFNDVGDETFVTPGNSVHAVKEDKVSNSTKRMCMMTKLYFLDYYFDLLSFIHERKQRVEKFKDDGKKRNLSEEQYKKEWKNFCGKERTFLRNRRTRMRVTNFQIIKQVGQGGYGQVFLARKKDDQNICALKKMSKQLLLKLGEVQHILTERDILTRTDSPWLVKLFYAFQDSQNVYLAMEYVPGGDVRTMFCNSGVLREYSARFYIAEMLMAVSEIHKLGYIHRDLKPENFLVDAGGHLKLTDFGLSRGSPSARLLEVMQNKVDMVKNSVFVKRSTLERRNIFQTVRKEEMKGYSLVGSPDYMAPEVLVHNDMGYGLAVDYWSLGCILFEMLTGFPPFSAQTNNEIWVNIYYWKKVLERPIYSGQDAEFNMTDEAWSLINKLITDQEKRWTEISLISKHKFFTSPSDESLPILSFEDLRKIGTSGCSVLSKDLKVPHIPVLKNELDTSYFDDFDNIDVKMYKEIFEKQENDKKNADFYKSNEAFGGRAGFVGFTFNPRQELF
ncbi:hypothetical protein HK099_004064 [Clydaea vesicula]|uniref:non-specific serine/threonine protein kinase n=1 Tax=Clydaea vesicula TaxID=447962 RepID=A0AAD5U2T4_9FUNG|nr:hypothetical protein HK099_004064 [Clydaea vesicula]KAJ3382839.1 hypothetical protein HDU92_004544 [Lobulomyces angularis]